MWKESICALASMLALASQAVSAQVVQMPREGAIHEKRALEVRVIERADEPPDAGREDHDRTFLRRGPIGRAQDKHFGHL